MPSDLPIVTPDPPPSRPVAEKYGGLYYLGLAGLVVLVVLIVWFGVGLWVLRGVLGNIYVLHDSRRPEAERIAAAYALAHDPALTAQQAWDIVLRKDLPPLARYLVAESLSPEIVAADPRGYTLRVARSRGWPEWLRVLAIRPMAYAADDGPLLPHRLLGELPRDDSPAGLWSSYVRAIRYPSPGFEASYPDGHLDRVARSELPQAELARRLLAARRAEGPRRDAWLDQATQWMRRGDPACRAVWEGWEIRDGRIAREPAR
jgi:hypothetical protein